ncbi:MAG: outer membrane beta-barrel protein [Methylobacter sp.]|nr:outer membrane beta-barrel protein [Methylobacter sp.]
MLNKILLCGISLVYAIAAFAQDSIATPKKFITTLSGSADVYYRYDIVGESKSNNLTSFTNSHNAFELGMASIKVEQTMKTVSVVLDLGFGKRATEFSYNETGILSAIKQLYISYQPKDWIKTTAGSWATHIGYEFVDPHLNKNYSTSYMFAYGPFFHTGLKAEFFKGSHSFMIGIANPTDYKYHPSKGLNNKFALAQYGVVVNKYLTAYVNYVGGRGTDSLFANQLDVVLSSDINEKISLGFNATLHVISDRFLKRDKVTTNLCHGEALYLKYSPKPWVNLCLRGEYFTDKHQLKVMSLFSEGGSVYEVTLSANFKTHGLTFIPEFRFDGSEKKIFTDTKANPISYNASFLIAAIYNFNVIVFSK